MTTDLKSYKNIYDNNIILMYKGELIFDLVTSLIESLENRINQLEGDKKVKRVFYSAVTECIQNLYYHMDEVRGDDTISEFDSNAGLVLVMARTNFFKIVTGNYIPTKSVDKLQAIFEKINKMDADELRDYYREVLSDGRYSDKGTAGLGFLEIAKKTRNPLQYSFQEVNTEYSYFTFEVRISRLPQARRSGVRMTSTTS